MAFGVKFAKVINSCLLSFTGCGYANTSFKSFLKNVNCNTLPAPEVIELPFVDFISGFPVRVNLMPNASSERASVEIKTSLGESPATISVIFPFGKNV